MTEINLTKIVYGPGVQEVFQGLFDTAAQAIPSLARRWRIVREAAELRFPRYLEMTSWQQFYQPEALDISEFCEFKDEELFSKTLNDLVAEQSKLPEFGWEEFWAVNYDELTQDWDDPKPLEDPEEPWTAPAIEPYIHQFLIFLLVDWVALKVEIERIGLIRLALERDLKQCTCYHIQGNLAPILHKALDQELDRIQKESEATLTTINPQ